MLNTTIETEWYKQECEEHLDSPSLLLHYDGIARNIQNMIAVVGGNPDRLIPHVKTYKTKEIVQMMVAQGITKFKCATVAEAEMLAMADVKYIVLAHQLVGPKLSRLIELRRRYPTILISSLIDCYESAEIHHRSYENAGMTGYVFIDVNNGMNRTGHLPNTDLISLYDRVSQYPTLRCLGLHIYDGHLRHQNFEDRKTRSDAAFLMVEPYIHQVATTRNLLEPIIITGGTPSFPIHALRQGTLCSPGTCVLWDWGYGEQLPEQQFEAAAILFTRIISKPAPGYITVDLGHKAVASENPLDKRIKFLNLNNYVIVSQSEEHLVLQTPEADTLKVGDGLYGIPYHICPTVNLYEEVYVTRNNKIIETWEVIARKRKITI